MNPRTAESSLATIEGLSHEAGRIALGHFRNVRPWRKADRTLVTEADREVERFLRARLLDAFPGDGVLGEEFGRTEGGGTSRRIWAVDPIDGTSAFSAGLPIWGISIGLVEDGVPVLGVVHLPLIGETYSAAAGCGAIFNGVRIAVGTALEPGNDDFLCIPSDAHRRYRIRFSGKTRGFGCTAAHLGFTARGAAWGALFGRVNPWDVAGGAAILQEAGGRLEYLGGSRFDWTEFLKGGPAPDFLIAGSPGRIARMREMIEVVDAHHL